MARQALTHCQTIALFTDERGAITRTFLSPATRSCHEYISRWMTELGMHVSTDAVGNLRGLCPAETAVAKRLLIGSHLDTVPQAGAYDGVLGVVMGLTLVAALRGERLPFAIEVIGFSEEEGVRFGFPFIGSRAVAGTLDETALSVMDANGCNVRQAIDAFGLDASDWRKAVMDASAGAYLEFHIEQGPVLVRYGSAVGVVSAIAGQSRAAVTFLGKANHAGTTPMPLRQDALCAAAEWITFVETAATRMTGLVATVGRIEAKPGATNVVPGEVIASLDVRHASDEIRRSALAEILRAGTEIGRRRAVAFDSKVMLDQMAVPMDELLTQQVELAITQTGATVHRLASGAGHDAMILAAKLPSAMMFLRSPGGVSHHPAETVTAEDVEVALRAGVALLHDLKTCPYLT